MLAVLQYLTFCLISVITAIFIGLYFYVTRNFKFWHKLGIPYVKPTPFVGNLKECVLLQRNIGEQLQIIYNEQNDKPYVGIFSFDKPSLLVRKSEMVKNILVKYFHTFTDRITSAEEKIVPIFGNSLSPLKGRIWWHVRTNLTPAFTSRKKTEKSTFLLLVLKMVLSIFYNILHTFSLLLKGLGSVKEKNAQYGLLKSVFVLQ
jgi:hypothetical protein